MKNLIRLFPSLMAASQLAAAVPPPPREELDLTLQPPVVITNPGAEYADKDALAGTFAAPVAKPRHPVNEPLEPQPAPPRVRLIFDTDLSGDCDDAGALALLHALADRGECDLLAVVTNRKDKTNASAAAVDVINTYYGRPGLPLGTDKAGPTDLQRTSPYTCALRDGFPHDAKPDDQMPDALEIYRRVLSAEPGQSVTICSVGAFSNLAELWRQAPQLVAAKVRRLVVMGGEFPKSTRPETNIRTHVAAARLVAAEWPTEIVWHGFEIGQVLLTGARLKETPPDNPVRLSYELKPYGKRPAIEGGQPSWDQGAALFAVRGADPALWRSVQGGRVLIDETGVTSWDEGPVTPHFYVKLAGDDPKNLAAVIEELMIQQPKPEP